MTRKMVLTVVLAALTSVIDLAAQQVTLAKITLGTSQDQVKKDLGTDYKSFSGLYMKNLKDVSQMIVGGSTDAYWLLFFQDHLIAFNYLKQFPKGQEPLTKVLEQSITNKTWPQSHSKLGDNDPTVIWQSDSNGHPSTHPDQITADCSHGVPSWSGASLPTTFASLASGPGGKSSVLGLVHVKIEKFNPHCGVNIQMQPGFGNTTADIAVGVDLLVVDEKAMNQLVESADTQVNGQKTQENNKHNDVKSPF